STLSLHDALPISDDRSRHRSGPVPRPVRGPRRAAGGWRLGRAPARQALRALDLAGRPADGLRRPAVHPRPPLSHQGQDPRPRGAGHLWSTTGMRRALLLIPLAIFLVVAGLDRKSTRLNSSHVKISYAV